MNLEAAYYEDPAFWNGGMVEDAGNLQRLERTVAFVPQGIGNLVDVGCGNGVFARMLKVRRPEIHITCVDRSAAALQHVQADAKLRSEITALPFTDRSFDCVTCLEVLEHLTCQDYRVALAELARVARDTIIIGVPFNEAIDKNVDTCPQCRTVFNRDLHLRSFDDATFRELLTANGFRNAVLEIPVVSSHYLGFRSYYALQRKLRGEASDRARFMSPLCPLCGYSPERPAASVPTQSLPAATAAQAAAADKMPTAGLKGFVKRLWPKHTTPGYWILGRFERV